MNSWDFWISTFQILKVPGQMGRGSEMQSENHKPLKPEARFFDHITYPSVSQPSQ